jgi:hypothetical protein
MMFEKGGEGNEETGAEEEIMPEITRSINETSKEGGQLLGAPRISAVFCDESIAFGKILSSAIRKGNWNPEARKP